MLCYVMLCYVMLCYVMLCYVMLCFVLFCYVLFCFVLFCFVLFCFVLFCFVLFCFVLFCFVRDKDIKREKVAPNNFLPVQGAKRDLPADKRLLRCQSESSKGEETEEGRKRGRKGRKRENGRRKRLEKMMMRKRVTYPRCYMDLCSAPWATAPEQK